MASTIRRTTLAMITAEHNSSDGAEAI